MPGTSHLKSLLRGRTSRGVRQAIKRLRSEYRLQRVHRQGVALAKGLRGRSGLKLHLGSGANLKEGWVNVDAFDPVADLALDLREEWPFDDGSASVVYAEHVFEHLEYPGETGHFLREALRVLSPGGIVSLGVPDSEWVLRAYFDPDDDYWNHVDEWHPDWCETRLDHVNYHFRQIDEHRYAYDEETLVRLLQTAGFADARRREWDEGLDSAGRRLGTLYVHGQKPSR